MSEEVLVAFYRPESATEPWINKLTAYWTGEFSHCEVVFLSPQTKRHTLAASVYQGEKCFFKEKTFGRTSWSFRRITLTTTQVNAMKAYVREQARAEKPFNTIGLVRCVTAFPRTTDETCFFCSELVICAFQKAGVFCATMPSMVTPSALFKMLDEVGDTRMDGSPFMAERINQKGLSFSRTSQATTSRQTAVQGKGAGLAKKWSQFKTDCPV